MRTRRAAKKQRIETGPLLGPVHLPSEVIGNNLLRCLDLPSLLRLSMCNSAVKREVFRKQLGGGENASIWQTIDFGWVSKEMASKLTDDQLKKLLVKCHAREVTTILKLTGCVSLKGKGLEPLRGSIALREIDLRLSETEGLESAYVLNLLSSMPPIAPVPASFGNRHLGLSLIKSSSSPSATSLFKTGTIGSRLAPPIGCESTTRRSNSRLSSSVPPAVTARGQFATGGRKMTCGGS